MTKKESLLSRLKSTHANEGGNDNEYRPSQQEAPGSIATSCSSASTHHRLAAAAASNDYSISDIYKDDNVLLNDIIQREEDDHDATFVQNLEEDFGGDNDDDDDDGDNLVVTRSNSNNTSLNSSSESMSTVSALTFEDSQFYGHELDEDIVIEKEGKERKIVSSNSNIAVDGSMPFFSRNDKKPQLYGTHEYKVQQAQANQMHPKDKKSLQTFFHNQLKQAPGTPVKNNKSKRLTQVHEKVIMIQKENKALQEKNLRLMLQMSNHQSSSSPSNQNIQEENAIRLGKIYDKVQQVQDENELLKKETLGLRQQIKEMSKLNHSGIVTHDDAEAEADTNVNVIVNNTSTSNEFIDHNYSMEVNPGISPIGREKMLQHDNSKIPKNLNLNDDTSNKSRSQEEPNIINLDWSLHAVAPMSYEPATGIQTKVAQELSRQRREYLETKKRLDEQRRICSRLIESGSTLCQSCANPNDSNSKSSIQGVKVQTVTQYNKENIITKKKKRGLLISRKGKNDKKIQELIENTSKLENQLQKFKLVRNEDIEKIAHLGSENIQQRTLISSLERQLKQKNLVIKNLETEVEMARCEMLDVRDIHELEKEELQVAYDELKTETSELVTWLRKQLSEYQGRSKYADGIANAIDDDDDDLGSLTKSEEEGLMKEIAEETEKWVKLNGGYHKRAAMGLTEEHNQTLSNFSSLVSVDASTLTPPSTT